MTIISKKKSNAIMIAHDGHERILKASSSRVSHNTAEQPKSIDAFTDGLCTVIYLVIT